MESLNNKKVLFLEILDNNITLHKIGKLFEIKNYISTIINGTKLLNSNTDFGIYLESMGLPSNIHSTFYLLDIDDMQEQDEYFINLSQNDLQKTMDALILDGKLLYRENI